MESEYIPGLWHAMAADDLTGVRIEEAVPVGEKRRGWAGVWHALTSPWTVQTRTL